MRRRRPSLLSVGIAAAAATLLAVHFSETWTAPESLRPRAVAANADGLRLGVTTVALARNSHTAWRPQDLVEVDGFERDAGRRADVVMWFADWEHARFDPDQVRAVRDRGAIPEISWEPWDSLDPRRERQPGYRLRTIIEGRHDATIRRWARAIAKEGGHLRLRFAHEMNGRWYPWAERANDNHEGEYVKAWRHVRRLFREEGATNVAWVWCPVAGDVPRRLFPGRDEIDVAAVAGFNGGDRLFRRRWRSFATAFGPTLDRLERLAPDAPIEISEISSVEEGGSKAEWIRGMFAEIRRRPQVRTLVWFHVRKEADWRITSSPAAQEAFAAGLRRAGP